MSEVPNARDLGENVTITMADYPAPGTDWRAAEGFGWIFKAWFRNPSEAREAREAIAAAGWKPERLRWGRKVRAPVEDGYEGEALVRFVTSRWPHTRIQLRND
jgi:hypothetical protein